MLNNTSTARTNFFRQYWPAFAGIAFAFALALTLFLIRSNLSKVDDFPDREISNSEQQILFHVDESATGLEIARDLFNQGVTASITSFYQLAIADPKAMQISPGEYLINTKISAKQALAQLLDPSRIQNLVSIIEGDWRSEIFAKLQKVGFTDLEQALKKIEVPKGFSKNEGIFFPAQYSFAKDTTSQMAIQKMVDRFVRASEDVGLFASANPYEKLIIASLIQAEGDPDDFGKVSRVIYNRLKIGMPLQLDATVQYALKKRGSIWVTTQSTKIDSPYNTYRKYGLPEGPIGSPGSAALRAALQPEPGDWLYFITVKPKDTRFTKSHDQFLKWKIEFQSNVKAGLFE